MMKIVRGFICIIALSVLMTGSVLAETNTTVNVTINSNVPLEETGQAGRVSWDQGVIEAIGTGVPPTNATSMAQSRALTRRAAIVEAYRNLAETIQGVQVDSETTMANLQINSDIVKTKVSGLIRGAKIIREQAMADGSYQVVMSIKLYGSDGVAGIALNAVKPEQIQDFPTADYKSFAQTSSYTGVIVDARGLGLEPTFSPIIYDETGRTIYGSAYLDVNFAISKGMVDYAPNSDLVQEAENGQSRAGATPIIVKAISIKGNNCNVVVSKEDGDKILSANQSTGFLKRCAVVFED